MNCLKGPGWCVALCPVRSFAFHLLAVMCAAFLTVVGVAQAADVPEAAPVNPQYLQWKSERDAALRAGKSTMKVTSDGHPLGAIPSRIDRSYLKATTSEAAQSDKAAYPAAYDLRDHKKLTPIRDQNRCNSSWSFGSYASLEAKLMPGKQTDFAESHLIDQHGYDYGPCEGGWFDMAIAYLARWAGPVPENQYPYQYLLASSALPATSPSAVMTAYHVQDVELIATTTANIKSAVMKWGPVGIEFYYGPDYYNSSTIGYYCNTDLVVNQIAAIVGWNDNYPKGNFTKAPAGDGAYLVRNSWGTGWGDKGYFWMSYYDKSIGESGYIFDNAEATTNYNWIYQYDTLGMTNYAGYVTTDTAWMANIFKANPLGSTIKAVSFYAAVDNTNYTVYIYDKVQTTVDKHHLPVVKPRSGTLVRTQTGTVRAGYHTVKLIKPAKVTSGKDFSVVMKVTTPGYGYPMACEAPYAGYSSRATAIQGQSYVSRSGANWGDLPLYDDWADTNVCLKAFGSR